ncbi:hypothetical protein [Frigidibacter sp. MR17.24]|uniref:hypothetical protein n=1 Tax=Frigidibacter sp. MR17.24 TaxID=3127345 RepID=UPI0030131E02
MQFGLTQLLWSLGGAGSLFFAMKFARIGVWLLLRPGGWAVVVLGILVAVKAMDPGPEAPVLAEVAAPAVADPVRPAKVLPARTLPARTLPDRAMQPAPMRP